MLQRDRQFRTQLYQLTDAAIFAFSFWLAYMVRADHTIATWLNLNVVDPEAFKDIGILYFVLVPAAPLVLESQGFYTRPMLGSRIAMFWPLFKGCLILTIGLVLLLFLFKKANDIPRGVMIFFGVTAFCLTWIKEEGVRLILRSRLAKSQYKRRVAIVATGPEIVRLRALVRKYSAESMEIAAEFDIGDSAPHQLIELLHEHSVSGVLVSARHTQLDRIESVIRLCEVEGVEAWLVADFFATQIAQASFDEMFGHPLLVFRSTPETSWQVIAKFIMDVVGALLLVILLSPVLIAIAIGVKLTSPGPILFRQKRSGVNGAPFTIYKFRTMATNAEQTQHELAAMNEMSGPVFKVTNDPRITKFGKWLRKYSLDELPQLFNVLQLEMSLVGPRPLPVNEVKRFNDLAHRRRLSVKPGLTCLWQVSGRNKITDFTEWVRLDLQYIDNWSIWLDLAILIRTIPAVVQGTGAK